MHEGQDVVIPEIWSIYTDTLETKVLKKSCGKRSSCNFIETQITNKKKDGGSSKINKDTGRRVHI